VTEQGRPPIGMRHVVLATAAAVVVVLALQIISQAIQPLDDALGFLPILIVTLIAVTIVVLFRTLRPHR
jgi:polyferredoxin